MQTFLDHAAHIHDERVMKGERGPELFPRPLFEEPPMQQREKIYEYTLRRLKVQSIPDNLDNDVILAQYLCTLGVDTALM